MGKWDHVERFQVGDEVEHPSGAKGVIVLSYPRKKDGRQFPMVRVTEGGGWDPRVWPVGWSPLLDRGKGRRLRCQECERPFEASADVSLCRSCHKQQEDAVSARVALESQEMPGHAQRDVSQRPWRDREW